MNRGITLILAIGLILTASSSWAWDQGERIERRYDLRGDRIAQALDAKGDRIQCQYDRLALHAALRGDFGPATALRTKGARINAQLDRTGGRFDRQLDKQGRRISRKPDRHHAERRP